MNVNTTIRKLPYVSDAVVYVRGKLQNPVSLVHFYDVVPVAVDVNVFA